MKWFKHISDSHNDPDLQTAVDRFGHRAYAAFWILLELYAKEFDHFDGENDFVLRLSWVGLKNKLRMKSKATENILSYFSERGRIIYTRDGDEVTVHIPKFQELASDYTRQRRHRAKVKKLQDDNNSDNNKVTPRSRSRTRSRKDLKPIVYECDFFKIDAKTHETYQAAFPDVDLMEQYIKMAAWLVSRPGAEYGQIMVFVYEWLKREHAGEAGFEKLANALKGGGAKGMPKEAHAKPKARYEKPETLQERCERKAKERK